MLNCLHQWADRLRWQRLPSFRQLTAVPLKHLEGILNHGRTKVRHGAVAAIGGNIRMLVNRGRGECRSLQMPAESPKLGTSP
jgi:hypothetical protein